MIKKIIFPLLILITLSGCSQTKAPEKVIQTITRLEKSFQMKSIQYITPVLSKEFQLNDFSPLLSKQVLAGMLSGFPLKKIKDIEVLENKNDTIQVSCKLVIDKYMGLLSQQINLTLVNDDNKLLIQKMFMPDADMEVTMEDDNSKSTTKTINLDDYKYVVTKEVSTFYQDGLESIASEVNQKQVKGIGIAEKILDEELVFKLGLLLTKDSLENATIDQPVLPITIHSEDYEADEKTGFFINWAYFHELVELQLTLGKGIQDQNTRWFRDGLADYVAHRVAEKLNPTADSLMMKKRMHSYDEIGRKADLLNWIGTGNTNQKMDGIIGGAGQYAGALMFFIDLTQKYGENIIPDLLKRLNTHKEIDTKVIIDELNDLTGSNIREMIEKY